jgi:LmbE family N-acetylglucosaminyl deacetylase
MNIPSATPKTILFIHAHPDDEALLTAGTMARAASSGHHVVLLVMTDGAAGLTSTQYSHNIAAIRQEELQASASKLGVESVISWDLPDSGLMGEHENGFAHRNLEQLSDQLGDLITDIGASIVVGYDSSGGYGHPDHLQVHRLARHAYSQGAHTFALFEATMPREPIARAAELAEFLHLTPKGFSSQEFATAWTPRANITHKVNVRAYINEKRAAIKAHASQAHADNTVRTLGVLSALPSPIFSALLGTEFFVKVPKNLAS